jgi:hypothetical protein
MAEFDWAIAVGEHQVTASEVRASTWLKAAPKGGSEPQVWDCGDEIRKLSAATDALADVLVEAEGFRGD